MKDIIGAIEENPIIAAIRSEEDLQQVVKSPVTTVFILWGDIFQIRDQVTRIKKQGKKAFLHMDFIEGLGRDQKAIDYIHKMIQPDGIISTRSNHIKYAKEIGLFTIQRFFLIDSKSYETTVKTVKSVKPDMIEVMPGVLPHTIEKLTKQLSVPIIAGGLIEVKEDIIAVLKVGALGVSVGKKSLWAL
ncbi:glycerol-3-phosphate responsive antiterminator [Vallitalea pronyensis]|uniref:Glycerol-3-phosphate responsive antiterminator n=1 Tax=Vallitalea pronyensis TaxID=1348613 RepID=A0A8J8MK06_9FIRM|nr:glycerol-3-phosphate responsive antiterminator [Vallitalea pronyensis]QUI22688.1 glycerol-3-phosphate responsive antiterminator [Vallitalea pronyensis]